MPFFDAKFPTYKSFAAASLDEVTFEAIARPHWKLTKRRATGRNLVIGDTTELDCGKHRQIEGAGPTGKFRCCVV